MTCPRCGDTGDIVIEGHQVDCPDCNICDGCGYSFEMCDCEEKKDSE